MHVFWESQHTPHHSSRTKRHILGMSTDFCRAKLCRLSCKLITSIPRIPPKILLPWSVFWGLAKPLCRNSEISHRHMLLDISSCLFFQKWLKSVQDKQDKCPKACIVLVTEKKHVLAEFGRTPGAIHPNCYVSLHCCPTLTFLVLSTSVLVFERYSGKNPSQSPK